jgi:hypothetical protein
VEQSLHSLQIRQTVIGEHGLHEDGYLELVVLLELGQLFIQ